MMALKDIDEMGASQLGQACVAVMMENAPEMVWQGELPHLLRIWIQQKLKWVTTERYDPREPAERGLPPYQTLIWKRVDHGSFEQPSYMTHPDWYGYADNQYVALYRAFLKAWHEVTE